MVGKQRGISLQKFSSMGFEKMPSHSFSYVYQYLDSVSDFVFGAVVYLKEKRRGTGTTDVLLI